METSAEHTSSVRKRLSDMRAKIRHSSQSVPTIREVPQSSGEYDDST